ncbi:MAG: acetoacetate--CoA ligase [Desulfitobacteriaceae bacterium]
MREVLWEPSEERKLAANVTRFREFVKTKFEQDLKTYDELYEWSIEQIPDFWAAVWKFGGIIASKPYDHVLTDGHDMFNARWFVGAELNFAENLLRYRDDRTAIVFRMETGRSRSISYNELYRSVARMAESLRALGVTVGDRVAGYLPNIIETVVAMLATTSIGAVWSACSPDFGLRGVLDRFAQIQPKVMVATNGYLYNGKPFDVLDRVKEIAGAIPSVEKVIIVPFLGNRPDLNAWPQAVLFEDFLSSEQDPVLEFVRLPFDHPVYIMYSSGTTGIPKGIVHGAGGTLIQHLKEHLLHTDLKREDVFFYFTTCGWMMWNWLVSALALGVTIVLYDGSPFYPDPGVLWSMVEEEKVTVFGTSAKYLSSLEKSGLQPGEIFNLSTIKTILSTGSTLPPESFYFIYRSVKKDVCLSSITGGTDIISCFAPGNPLVPVVAGQLQRRGLGMKVESFDENGKSLVNQKGELVCTAPFPSRPVFFWNDPGREKYRSTYFNLYPNVWRHGDYIEISGDGGLIVYGRSDTTLNPGGVRIGTAEIYRQMETLPEIADSLAVGQQWEGDVRVILFVKLVDPDAVLTPELVEKIRRMIREHTTSRHVPARIIAVNDIPYTLNGKKVEIAVYNIIHNEAVPNRDALANPEALEFFRNRPELMT